jgi:hypothetical protein
MTSDGQAMWEFQPAAGWETYRTMRARFLARLGMETRLLEIEQAWRAAEVQAGPVDERPDVR